MKKHHICLSIVSHGQGYLISNLLNDIKSIISHKNIVFSIRLVINIPEDESFLEPFKSLPMSITRNLQRKGFGANHNLNFSLGPSDYFCVLNPDLRLNGLDFFRLVSLMIDTNASLVSPLIKNSSGTSEDSVRFFPTMTEIFLKSLGKSRIHRVDIQSGYFDWIGGMFHLFKSSSYNYLKGYDEKYYMYYEDVDICKRLRSAGETILIDSSQFIIHDAQRDSWTSLKYRWWHIQSFFRFSLIKRFLSR